MTPQKMNSKLDAYCDLREALGFQSGKNKNTLRDFLRYWQSKGCPEPDPVPDSLWNGPACVGLQPAGLSVVRCFLSAPAGDSA